MKSKFQVVSDQGTLKNLPKEIEIEDLTNEETILKFLKQQVAELEDYVKLENRIPLQKVALVFSFGEDDSAEEALKQFQYISFNISTPDFFLLVDTMKTKYIQDITQS